MTAGALQDKKMTVWPINYCATRTRNLSQLRVSHQNPLFCRKMNFHIPHIPYYKYPYTHEM